VRTTARPSHLRQPLLAPPLALLPFLAVAMVACATPTHSHPRECASVDAGHPFCHRRALIKNDVVANGAAPDARSPPLLPHHRQTTLRRHACSCIAGSCCIGGAAAKSGAGHMVRWPALRRPHSPVSAHHQRWRRQRRQGHVRAQPFRAVAPSMPHNQLLLLPSNELQLQPRHVLTHNSHTPFESMAIFFDFVCSVARQAR
jgi:hypothetical protein